MKCSSAIIISTALWVGAAQAADKDGLCDALDAYAKAIPAASTRSLTLKTEWGAEPTVACASTNEAPEKKLCAYLSENVSMEFMATNIKRFLICLGAQLPDSNGLWFDFSSGKTSQQASIHLRTRYGRARIRYRTRCRFAVHQSLDHTPVDTSATSRQ